MRQPPPRPRRDGRPPGRRRLPVTRHRGRRASSPPASHCGIKATGAPDLALVATADGAPVAAAGVFTAEPRVRRPGAGLAAPPRRHRRPGRRRRPQQRQRQLRHRHRRAPSPRRCAALTAKELGCAPEHVLVCSTGLIGIPLDRRAASDRHPRAWPRARHADGGDDAAPGDHDHRHRRRRPSWSTGDGSPSAAWPRARRCSPPTWRRCSPCSPPTPRSSPPTLHARPAARRSPPRSTGIVVDGCTSTNDTVILLASRAPPVRRRSRRLRRSPSAPCALARPADGARRRGRTPRSCTSRSTGAASDDEAERGRPQAGARACW